MMISIIAVVFALSSVVPAILIPERISIRPAALKAAERFYGTDIAKTFPRPKKYKNLNGVHLTVAAIDNWPFLAIKKNHDGQLTAYKGIDYNILLTFSKLLNFSFGFVTPADEQWGQVLENGTVTGMIGMVHYGKADLSINEITINGLRESVVDFTDFYFMEATTILSRAPGRKSQTWQAFSPFTYQSWISVSACAILTGPILYLIYKVSPEEENERHSPSLLTAGGISLECFRILLKQETRLFWKSDPLRIASLFWYFFCFIIGALYATSVIAFLTIPTMDQAIDSLTDLLRECQQEGVEIVIMEGSSNDILFKKATGGIYKDLWTFFQPSSGYIVNLEKGPRAVMHRDKAVFINAELHTSLAAQAYGEGSTYLARQTFYPQSYGVAVPTGSHLKEAFEPVIYRLVESGLISKWARDAISEREQFYPAQTDPNAKETRGGLPALSIADLQAAFFVLSIGMVASTMVLLLEYGCFHIRS